MPLKEIKSIMEIAVVAGLFTLSATLISNIFISLRSRKDEKHEHERLNDKNMLLKEGQGNLSAEHDRLLSKQEKLLDKQSKQESILMLLREQIETEQRNKERIRDNIGINLSEKVDSSIATLQILAEEMKQKNEEIKDLKALVNYLEEENEQLSKELKEYKKDLSNHISYDTDREEELEL